MSKMYAKFLNFKAKFEEQKFLLYTLKVVLSGNDKVCKRSFVFLYSLIRWRKLSSVWK